MNIVQIGCNDGKDHVLEFIKNSNPNDINSITLVDALPKCLEIARANYSKFLSKTKFYNLCISDGDETEKDIFCPKLEKHGGDTSQLASVYENHLIGHDVFDYEKLRIPSLNINKFLQDLGAETNLLFIDVEGYDCDLIMALDLEKFHIDLIHYETHHSDGPYKRLAKAKLAIDKLKKFGYSIADENQNNIDAVKIGGKINLA
jgi:FkbM family methyltransferase